ncbi:hypothetical protein [Frigidibacter oleivorans]|uniref:hypothetical protein n=1 Tax=Frigidibacter oleivorans TaxID=2487129 RepID=UPI000F8DB1A9|nr:hypothetical protein [Frigidibacter oleivorans]
MLMPVAGCRLYIGGAVGDAMAYRLAITEDQDWAEIAEAESLGVLGTTWATITYLPESDGPEFARAIKDHQTGQTMQIILGADPSNEGQQRLWQAHGASEDYAFRLDFPDGVTRRCWRALVIGFSEVFDEANSILKMQADLQINGPITRLSA